MTISVRSVGPRVRKPVERLIVLLASAVALSACVSPGEPRPDPTETVRPRIAQVVDADSGRPVPGAMVLVVFYLWPERGFGNFPASKVFRDSREAFTDEQGRFEVKGPFDSRSGTTEDVYIFKPGYGPWRFQGQDTAPSPRKAPSAFCAWLRGTWQAFTSTGVVIELRPLRTREERVKYVEEGWEVTDALGAGFERETPYGSYFFDVPSNRLANFQALVDQERASLGLAPRPLSG